MITKIKKLLICAMAFIITTTISSCEEEDKVKIDINYCCSPDLLEFVIPTLHYTEDSGQQTDITLSKTNFKLIDRGNITIDIIINGEKVSIKQNFEENNYTFTKSYSGWTINDNFQVTYELKKDIEIEPEKEYVFYHTFSNYTVTPYKDGMPAKVEVKDNTIEVRKLKGREVSDYLASLPYTTVDLVLDITVKQQ